MLRRIALVAVASLIWWGVLPAPVRATHSYEIVQQEDESVLSPDIVVSPDGLHVYVAKSVDDALVQYDRDPGTGLLTEAAVVQDGVGGVDGLAGVRRLAITPDGAHVITASAEDALTVFSRDGGTGSLTQIQVLRQGVDGVDGLELVHEIVVTPDGEHVYAGRWPDQVAVRGPTVFDRDAGTGLLAFVEVTPEELGIPSAGMAFSSDGAQLYAVSGYRACCPLVRVGRLAVADRDLADGTLSLVQDVPATGPTLDDFHFANDIVLSGDGRNVYVPGTKTMPFFADQQGLAVFARDAMTGMVTAIEVETSFHATAHEAAMTPDDALLVTGSGPDDLGFFEPSHVTTASKGVWVRDPRDGTVSWFDVLEYQTGFGFSTGSTLAMAPSGDQFYAVEFATTTVWQRGACRPLWLETKSTFNHVITDPVANDDTFVLKGKGFLPGVSLADLDLDLTGMTIHVDRVHTYSEPPGVVADVTLGAGAYGGAGTVGWKKVSAGWVYLDTTGGSTNGVTKVVIKDLSRFSPDMLSVKVLAKRGGTYTFDPVEFSGDNNELPRVRLELGAPTRCLQTGAAECKANAVDTKVACKAER